MPRAYFDGLHMFLDLNFLIEVNGVCFGVGAEEERIKVVNLVLGE